MWPALKEGDRALVDRLLWRFHGLRRGDIVVLRNPVHQSLPLIKRIAGPGIERTDVRISRCVDGAYNCDRADRSPKRYVVRGERKEASTDSRSFGPVSEDDIIGRVILRY